MWADPLWEFCLFVFLFMGGFFCLSQIFEAQKKIMQTKESKCLLLHQLNLKSRTSMPNGGFILYVPPCVSISRALFANGKIARCGHDANQLLDYNNIGNLNVSCEKG